MKRAKIWRHFVVPVPYTGDQATIRQAATEAVALWWAGAERAAGREAAVVSTLGSRDDVHHNLMIPAHLTVVCAECRCRPCTTRCLEAS